MIVSHENPEGLYLTYFSLVQQLNRDKVSAEVLIVADGGSPVKWEKLRGTSCLRGCFGSPQASRLQGLLRASYETVLFVESHVIVSDPLRLVNEHRDGGATLTFPYRRSEGTELFDVYGHTTDWDGNLWYRNMIQVLPTNKSFPVSQFGHSCFVVDRAWFFQNGGYGDMLHGWGGEESYLCLKAWMLGGSCRVTPHVWHAHFASPSRHTTRVLEDEFAQNMLSIAYALGGEEQLEVARKRYPGVNYKVSPSTEAERKRICAGSFDGSIPLLRKYLASEGVN